MGKHATGEKQKFDLVTASKTKKYKIITGVILGIGVVLLLLSLLLKGSVTQAVVPNTLMINNLSNLKGTGPTGYTCVISQNETFTLSTGTTQGRALATPIKFTLLNGAKDFLEIQDSSYYDGLFTLRIRNNAPAFVENDFGQMVRPTGTLRITCGSYVIQIQFTYYAA